MNRQEYLKQVRKEIHFIFDRDAIEKELNNHLLDSVEDLIIEEGLSREEAETQAVVQMGDPVEVGKQLNEEHHPVLGYLWMMSNVLLLVVFLFAALPIGIGIWDGFQMITPTKLEESVATYPVKIEFTIPTHRVKLDNVCRDDKGQYWLTYRAWRNYNYSRAGWSSGLFYLEGSEGEQILTGGVEMNSIIGSYGAKDFEYPDDGILKVKPKGTDKVIEIDLGECCNEKR